MVRDVSLSGEIRKTLHSIVLCGDDRAMHQGYCGKGGQSVPVSDGAPHVLLLDAVVGGSGMDWRISSGMGENRQTKSRCITSNRTAYPRT